MLHEIAGRRLRRGRLTVVDATNVQREARAALMQVAREHDLFAVAIVLDLPEEVCVARNAARPDRDFGAHVIRRQRAQLKRSLRHLQREGFRRSWRPAVRRGRRGVEIVRSPMWTDRRAETRAVRHHRRRPRLLRRAGRAARRARLRRRRAPGRAAARVRRRPRRSRAGRGRRAAARDGMAAEDAICVPGNHDVKLVAQARRARRADHARAGGVARAAGGRAGGVRRRACAEFLHGLVSHAVLDGGRLVRRPRRHAGALPGPRLAARARVRAVRRDDGGDRRVRPAGPRRLGGGLPRRGDRRLRPHARVAEPEWLNNTINIDTGCVFGGALTALRWPERELVSVPAAREYYAPARPFLAPAAATERPQFLLDVDDVAGKRIVSTRLARNVTSRGERRGRAGGHVAVRDRPALARLPAADDGADRDVGACRTCSSTRPRRSPSSAPRASRRSSARRSTWARARSRSSAATRPSRRERFGDRGRGRAVHAHRAAVLRRRRAGLWPGCATRSSRAGLWEALDDGLARPGLRDAAVVGEGAGADRAPVRGRRRGGLGGPRRLGSALLETAAARGLDVSSLLASTRRLGAERVDRYRRRLRALRLAGRRRLGPAGGAVPRARGRVRRVRRPRPRLAPGALRRARRGRPGLGSRAPTAASSTSPIRRRRPTPPRGGSR